MAITGDVAHFHNGDFDAFGGYVAVKSESLEPDFSARRFEASEF